jgi:prophage tail gpP-like protein
VLETKEFKGWSFDAIARSLLQPYGFGISYKGTIDSAPFTDVTIFPGEVPFEAIDRLARHRGAILGDDSSGTNLVAADIINAPESGPLVGTLIEGQNIIAARATVVDLQLMGHIKIISQEAGSDQRWGADVSQNQVLLSAPNLMERGRYKPYLAIAEHAANMHDLRLRGQFEIAWRNKEAITAQITIRGWLNDSGSLWQAMDRVQINSPMLALNQALIIQAVTFTQDNNTGSRTTLELANLQGLQAGGRILPSGDGPSISDFAFG